MAFPFIQSENKREFVVDTEYLVQCVEIGLGKQLYFFNY